MIKSVQGNIFESKAHTLVNTVNCVGIMGKGLAKEFKLNFPDMAKEYIKACKRNEVRSGKPFLYKELTRNILCFPTKDNWKGPSKYEFIEAGLKAIAENYEKWDIRSIAIPPLGCGQGGLNWRIVKNLIIKYLQPLPIDVEIYEPLGAPDLRVAPKRQKQIHGKVNLTESLVYVGEIIRLARKHLPPEMQLGRLLIQKLAFFSQVAGVPINLRFKGYKYGPFDYNLKHVIDRLEGLYIRDISVSLQRSDIRMLDEQEWLYAIHDFENGLPEIRRKILAAIEIIKEHSNLEETELLSTVLFAWCALLASGSIGSQEEVIEFIDSWKPKKFYKEKIIDAFEQLNRIGWLCFECNKPSTAEPLVQLNIA
jgi:O-acetyl-ADP-ribose deacetylase (regulator of RNase III)/uncharacterized protein YwgA